MVGKQFVGKQYRFRVPKQSGRNVSQVSAGHIELGIKLSGCLSKQFANGIPICGFYLSPVNMPQNLGRNLFKIQ